MSRFVVSLIIKTLLKNYSKKMNKQFFHRKKNKKFS